MKQVAELRGLEDPPGLAPSTNGGRRPELASRWLYGSTQWCGLCGERSVAVVAGIGLCDEHRARAERIRETSRR